MNQVKEARTVSHDLVPVVRGPEWQNSFTAASLPGLIDSARQYRVVKERKATLLRSAMEMPPHVAESTSIAARILYATDSGDFRSLVDDPKRKRLVYVPGAKPEAGPTDENAQKLAKRLGKILHPDVIDPIADRVFGEDRSALFSQATEAGERNDLTAAQDIFLHVVPMYYGEVVQSAMKQGTPLETVVKTYPTMQADIDYSRYVQEVRRSEADPLDAVVADENEFNTVTGLLRSQKVEEGRMITQMNIDQSLAALAEYAKGQPMDKDMQLMLSLLHITTLNYFMGASTIDQRPQDVKDAEIDGLLTTMPTQILDLAKVVIDGGDPKGLIDPMLDTIMDLGQKQAMSAMRSSFPEREAIKFANLSPIVVHEPLITNNPVEPNIFGLRERTNTEKNHTADIKIPSIYTIDDITAYPDEGTFILPDEGIFKRRNNKRRIKLDEEDNSGDYLAHEPITIINFDDLFNPGSGA